MKKLLLVLVAIFTVGTAMAQMKLAHVDTQRLLDTMPSRKAAIEKLQKFEQDGVIELREMEEDLKKAYAKYEQERPSLSPVRIQIEEEKIMKKQQALQEREQSLNAEMQAYSNELNVPIQEKVVKAIEIVSERKKLNYVLDASMLIYSAGGADITDEVLVELMKLDVQ